METGAGVLHGFQVSFFAMARLSTFPWTILREQLDSDTSSHVISDILQQTCLHPLCRKHPPAATYRRLFLTKLIKMQQEATQSEPLDELYEALGEALGAQEGTECYKTYFLPGGECVTLLESVSLISEGTTGLVTWEAALYLAEWALDHRQVFTGRTVLELGSGMGLAGIAVCHCCRPSRFQFSDCHPSVLKKLRRNVQINGLTEKTGVSVEELDWTAVTEERLREIGADTVIATDVVYDPDVVAGLVQLLSMVLRCSSTKGPPEVIISSMIRNPDTYNCFKQQLEKEGIRHEVVTEAVSHVFPYNRVSAIEMIQLYI